MLATLADRAVRTFPTLRDVRINRTWAALRVMSPDGFLIYDQSRAPPGAFLATCHSGVTLAAAHAFELAPQMAAGELDADFNHFLRSASMYKRLPDARRLKSQRRLLAVTIDGKPFAARDGDTVAATLLAAGVADFRTTPVSGSAADRFA